MSAVLAAQVPAWTPGTRHGYHAVTLGWYESQLIRHADPLGRSLGQFFAEEVAKPLGLEFYIGLPASVDRDRVAYLHGYSRAELLLHLNTMPPRFVAALLNPRGLTARALANPKGIGDIVAYNREKFVRSRYPPAWASAPHGRWPKRTVASRQVCSDLGLAATLDALAARDSTDSFRQSTQLH